MLDRLRVGDQQRALAEVVEDQRRQHQAEPREPHRALAEVPHVGIQRLGPGDGEQHGAEHHERGKSVPGDEAQRVQRVERVQHHRVVDDVAYPDCPAPGTTAADRPENSADTAGAAALEREQRHQTIAAIGTM